MHRFERNSGRFDYSELHYNIPGDVNGESFAQGTEKSKVFASLFDKEVEDFDDYACPKVQDLIDEEMWICSSYPFSYKTTLHYAEGKAEIFGNWIMHLLKRLSFYHELYCQYLKI